MIDFITRKVTFRVTNNPFLLNIHKARLSAELCYSTLKTGVWKWYCHDLNLSFTMITVVIFCGKSYHNLALSVPAKSAFDMICIINGVCHVPAILLLL